MFGVKKLLKKVLEVHNIYALQKAILNIILTE